MMSCDVIRDLLPLYADGLVSEESIRLIEAHTAQCPACRQMMAQMCAPMETETEDEGQAYQKALLTQKRKNRRRLVLACVLSVLLCLVGWFWYMDTHFYTETGVITTTDGEKILSQIPELALTEAEKTLAERLWETEAVQDALGSTESLELPLEELQAILPENTACVSVYGNSITIEYWQNDLRIFLEYLGGADPGKASAIRKSVGVPRSEDDLSAKVVYTLEYVFALDQTWYRKQVMRHVWFSFLEPIKP